MSDEASPKAAAPVADAEISQHEPAVDNKAESTGKTVSNGTGGVAIEKAEVTVEDAIEDAPAPSKTPVPLVSSRVVNNQVLLS